MFDTRVLKFTWRSNKFANSRCNVKAKPRRSFCTQRRNDTTMVACVTLWMSTVPNNVEENPLLCTNKMARRRRVFYGIVSKFPRLNQNMVVWCLWDARDGACYHAVFLTTFGILGHAQWVLHRPRILIGYHEMRHNNRKRGIVRIQTSKPEFAFCCLCSHKFAKVLCYPLDSYY